MQQLHYATFAQFEQISDRRRPNMSSDTSQTAISTHKALSIPGTAKRRRRTPILLSLIRMGFRLGGTLSPRLAGRVAYEMWFTPTRFPTPASEQEALASAELEKLGIDDQSIVTYQWGRGRPTVLLVHGWSGRGTQLGAFVQPLVDAGYSVLSFDGPAHGRSSGRQTNLYQIADVILALQGHYGPFESVITHSFGGPCLASAMQHGFKTSNVVNIAPPAHVEALVAQFSDTLAIPEKAVKDFVRRFEISFGDNILQRASMVSLVRNLDQPVLVIHDEDDSDIPWQQGQTVARAWKHASFIKTRTLGHRRILRDPSTIETVVEFVRSNSG